MTGETILKSSAAAFELAGYVIEELLGQGGMGIVYRARDLRAERSVALKVLRRLDAASIYLFKREFRALANVVHPNLLLLYDLGSVEDTWFFTMELVQGRTFYEQAGAEVRRNSAVTTIEAALRAHEPTHSARSGTPDWERLRRTFFELACGVSALHAADKLHRDLKPSNVLVDAQGRVVVADFGLVADRANASGKVIDGKVYGTPEYMSPEQLAGAPLTPASDWYAFGVMLYEALTGALPFGARPPSSAFAPVAPHEREPLVPPALAELCMALLAFEPSARPSSAAILQQLSSHGPQAQARVSHDGAGEFVGRASERAALRARFLEVAPGEPRMELVVGASGVGKTRLLRTAADELARDFDCLVLLGRCHEREAVPYKAFDLLVDELSQYLSEHGDHHPELLGIDASALGRVFPVLGRALDAGSSRASLALEPFELRRRAFAAFKALLAAIAERRRLVLLIDDLQWGDAESAQLLAALLEPPDSPALFVLASARSEAIADSPMLRSLLDEHGNAQNPRAFVRPLHELSAREAEALAERLLAHEALVGDAVELARESRGLPLFVHELVRHAAREHAPADARASLEQVVLERVGTLPADARHALELVAVAGRALESPVLARALAPHEDALQLGRLLVREHLARVSSTPQRPGLECYHDRIRETVVASLEAGALQRCHRELASALEQSAHGDPEQLLEHHRAAGNAERAHHYALLAGDAAAASLAFARAARLYALALELYPLADEARLALLRKLGDALVYAGQTERAASVFVDAASLAQGDARIELMSAAAQHLLTTGQDDLGLPVLQRALGELGLSYPASKARALTQLLFDRLRLRTGGLRYRAHGEAELEPRARLRLDVCFSAAAALAMCDPLRSAAFSARHLRLALASGVERRIARGLAFELGVAPAAGTEGLRWAERALPLAERLAQADESPHARALFELANGHVDYLAGRFQPAVDWLLRAERDLRALAREDVQWSLLSANVLLSISLALTGRLSELAARLPAFSSEARERGDTYGAALLVFPRTLLALSRDELAAARTAIEEHTRTPRELQLRDLMELHSRLLIDRYLGDDEATARRIEDAWPKLERSGLLYANILRVTMLAERGSAAVDAHDRAQKAQPARAKEHASRALACARKLRSESIGCGAPIARLLEARLAWSREQPERALPLLAAAASELDACAMPLHAAATRLTLAAAQGEHELAAAASATLTAHGVRDVARFARLLVPGIATR